jgi:hypothetical protein
LRARVERDDGSGVGAATIGDHDEVTGFARARERSPERYLLVEGRDDGGEAHAKRKTPESVATGPATDPVLRIGIAQSDQLAARGDNELRHALLA